MGGGSKLLKCLWEERLTRVIPNILNVIPIIVIIVIITIITIVIVIIITITVIFITTASLLACGALIVLSGCC